MVCTISAIGFAITSQDRNCLHEMNTAETSAPARR